MIPCILHFVCYHIWMYTNSYEEYFHFLVSHYGISIITVLVFMFIYADTQIKKRFISINLNLPNVWFWKEVISPNNSILNKKIRKTLNDKSNLSLKDYLYRVYYYKDIVDKGRGAKLDSNIRDKATFKNKYDYFIGLIILLFTSLLFVYELIPKDNQELSISGLEIKTYGFLDVKTLFWYVSQKLVLFSLMTTWFITSPHWWRWAILSPILFYSYQFWEAFQVTSQLESKGNLSVFPFVFLTMGLVFLMSKVIRSHSKTLDYKAFLEKELDRGISELSRSEITSIGK